MTEPPPSSDASPSPDRYDLLLAVIPLALGVGVAAGAAGPLATWFGLLVGSLASLGTVAYGLFVGPMGGL